MHGMPKVKMTDLYDNLPPEGTYTVRVHEAKYVAQPKSEGANPYISTKLMVTGPDSEFVGRTIFANYPLTGGGTYRLLELLQVTGHANDFEPDNAEQLVGLEFKALVGIQKNDPWPDKNVVLRHLPLDRVRARSAERARLRRNRR